MTDWGTPTPTKERRVLVMERNRAVTELAQARVLVGALRTELRSQWETNHAEHCRNQWPHNEACYWPMPVVLEAT